jgi:hypothetical protein
MVRSPLVTFDHILAGTSCRGKNGLPAIPQSPKASNGRTIVVEDENPKKCRTKPNFSVRVGRNPWRSYKARARVFVATTSNRML